MNAETGQSKGSLTVVGTGMKFKSHMTLEVLEAINQAEKLYYTGGMNVMTRKWLEEMNPSAKRLPGYIPDRPRIEAYEAWIEVILSSVRQGLKTCAATYGHPGMFSYFARTSVRRARREGYEAVMLPGISAEANLFCDVLVDPAEGGWQSYQASYFLNRKPVFDTSSQLILWQIASVGITGPPILVHKEGLRRLTEYLLEHYGPEHEVIVYEAARNPLLDPVILRMPVRKLAEERFHLRTSLYIPPLGK